MRRIVLGVAACTAVLLLAASCAWADEPGPAWMISSRAAPTDFSAKARDAVGGDQSPGEVGDGYSLVVRNSGSRATDGSLVTISDTLPSGIEPTNVEGYDIGPGFVSVGGTIDEQHPVPLACELRLHSVTCTDGRGVSPGDVLYVSIEVIVSPGLKEGERVTSTAMVFGGGAPQASTSLATMISSAPAPFGFEGDISLQAAGLGGLTDTQAGDHPYEFTVTFNLNTALRHTIGGEFLQINATEDPKDVVTDLPPGFVGNPQVVQKCSQQDAQAVRKFLCPAGSQVGVARLNIQGLKHYIPRERDFVPIYNVVPDNGAVAQFMFAEGPVPTMILVKVSQDTNYALRTIVAGIPRAAENTAASVTFFGEPLTNHDIYNQNATAAPLAFLQNPVDCAAGPLRAKVSMDSWQHPGRWLPDGSPNLEDPNWKQAETVVYPSMTGCNMLQFEPSIQLTLDTTRADEPMGLNVNVEVPQAPDRFPALATPELKDATVTLPAGVSLSPSAADGLGACTDAQIALESIGPATCPDASVLGTVKITVPALESPLNGQVYLGTPECDPCGSTDATKGKMVRIFIEAAGSGVRIKKEGRVYLNPSTGQLTSRFENNPEDPFEELQLDFKGGLRAGLATPQSCGTFTTTSDFVPWSSPVTPDSSPIFPFDVSWDGNGGVCPSIVPLTPSFSAGTSNPNAGQFSSFTLTFAREDREQDLSGIQVRLPPGLSGILTGVPLCGEPQAQEGKCSEASRIGTMTVAAGPGSHPFYTKGSIYLTGPYCGPVRVGFMPPPGRGGCAPFGLSIVVPTKAGPFTLAGNTGNGTEVVRSKINVDVHSTALTVTSDPFPQVIAGIPLRLRTANVTIERPRFTFNPTSCEQLKVSATIAGAQGSQAQVSAPFAVAGCAGLHFGPKFKASTNGRTSRRRGASLDVKLTFPKGPQSNVARVKVDLPKALPSRLTTLQKACPARTFEVNPSSCPKASIVGIARAVTPLLPVTLTGPAYFVSHGGEQFPNLIIVLQGYGVRVDLVGDTFINKKNITSSTFSSVPDAPVSSFELYLPQGLNSALAANGNLCKHKLVMPTLFTAQDGAQLKQSTKIVVTGCPKAKKKTKKARR